MSQIQSKSKKYQYLEEPTTSLQSEGDILIKELAKKQRNTKINLNDELLRKKEFTNHQELVQLSDFKSGECSLEEFTLNSNRLKHIEELRFCGLSTSEIEFYLDSIKGDDFLNKKHKNVSKTILDERLIEINNKIKNKQRQNEKDKEINVSRHKKELGLSVKPNSEETKLYNFALSNLPKQDNVSLNDPINNLKDIEQELFKHLKHKEVPTLAKRRKKLKKLENYQFDCPSSSKCEKKSKWDIEINDTTPKIEIKTNLNEEILEKKIYTCQSPNYYTIKNGEIVKLNEKKIDIKKLTETEIKENAKFKNYEKGVPTNVLYVKNIARNAKEEFLNLFDEKNEPNIKIMTGKMQGQAFLTYKTEKLATEALNKYNGIIIKEKPIIISYGKSK